MLKKEWHWMSEYKNKSKIKIMNNTKVKNELKRGIYIPFYSIEDLKPAKVNRDLFLKHAENFKTKLKENDWLLPIIIAANGDVIEGHHRIESAKLLGETTVPVYVVDWVNTNNAEEHLKCIINLNNGNKAWTSLDYLKSFARKNKDYRKVYNAYLKNSNNISVGNIINCYFGYGKANSYNFKKGTSLILNESFADFLVNKFSHLNQQYGKGKIAAYCVRELIVVAYTKAKMDIKTVNFLFKKYEEMAKSDHPSITSINKFKPLMELYLNEYNMKTNNKNK